MKNLIKKGLITATAIGTAATGFIGVATFAQEAPADQQYPPFIEQLAERFSLNIDEVKTFFQEHKETRRQQKQERKTEHRAERLQKAIEDGTLTQEQADLLKQKHEEMKIEREARREEMKNLTPEERQAKRAEHQAEMKAWAQEHGIDLSQLHKGQRAGKKQMRRNTNDRPAFNQLQSQVL